MSSIESNKAIARRFLELVSEHKIDELCEMISPSWRMHGGPPALPPGPEGIRTLFGTFGTIERSFERALAGQQVTGFPAMMEIPCASA